MATLFKIDGVSMPAPSSISYTVNTLTADENRNTKGKLKLRTIAIKKVINVEYNNIKGSDLKPLLNAIIPKIVSQNFKFSIQVQDYTGTTSMQAYIQGISYQLVKNDANEDNRIYSGVSIPLTEF